MRFRREDARADIDRILAERPDRNLADGDSGNLRLDRLEVGPTVKISDLHQRPAFKIEPERQPKRDDGAECCNEHETGEDEKERTVADDIHS